MISDYKIIHHEFDRQAGITIIPVCDVHLGAADCNEAEFRAFIKAVADSPNTYITLGGRSYQQRVARIRWESI